MAGTIDRRCAVRPILLQSKADRSLRLGGPCTNPDRLGKTLEYPGSRSPALKGSWQILRSSPGAALAHIFARRVDTENLRPFHPRATATSGCLTRGYSYETWPCKQSL